MTVGAVHTNKLTSTLSLEDKAGWGIFRPKPDTNQPTTLQGDMIDLLAVFALRWSN